MQIEPLESRRKDAASGVVFIVIAMLFGTISLGYDRGTFFQMGPGMFPLLVSILLLILGTLLLLRRFSGDGTGGGVFAETFRSFSLRAVLCVVSSPILFALTVEHLGFVPASALVVTVGCFASQTMTLLRAILAVAFLVAFAWAVFLWGLDLPIPALGTWLTGF